MTTAESGVRPDESKTKSFMDYPGARAAFAELVNDKVDEQILKNLLQLQVIFGGVKRQEQHGSPPRRVIRSVSSKAIALANQISQLNRDLGILEARAKEPASIKFDWFREFPLTYPEQLPQVLREFSQAIDEASKRPRPHKKIGDDSILRLLVYIKRATGRYHYEAVATLLDAVDYAISKRDVHWNPSRLKQQIYRSKERLRTAPSSESWIHDLIHVLR
jgi:hypothetical protein